MTTTTLAVRIERHGPPEVLRERQVPLLEPGPGQVRLAVRACGVNFADLLMRAGLYGTTPPLPYSPGFEVAGEVTAAGTGTEGWAPGDRAVALLRHGGYARELVVPAGQLFPCPDGLGFVEAAAIPVTFLTAWVALFDAARARAGETILILGAAGGVGTAAVQLARDRGLEVVGTAGTPEKRAFVTDALGARACFDSRGDWEPDVRRLLGHRALDLALDPVGGDATAACRRLLAPLGRLVFYGLSQALPGKKRSLLRAAWAWLRTPRIHPLDLVEPNQGVFGIHLLHLGSKEEGVLRPAMEEIFRGVREERWRPIVDRTFTLDGAGAVEAHRHLHRRRNLGKVVLVAPE